MLQERQNGIKGAIAAFEAYLMRRNTQKRAVS